MSDQKTRSRFKFDKKRAPAWARQTLRRLWWRMGPTHTSPIFVLGNQKSGTTVIAASLAACTGQSAMLDIFNWLNDFGIEDRLFSGDLSVPRFVAGHRRFFRNPVIKDPSLTFFYPELRAVFPNAQFVFVARDPRDNIRSILNRLRIPGTETDLDSKPVREALRENLGWRGIIEGRNPPTSRETIVATLAARWQLAADVYLRCPEQFVLLRYEDFLEDKLGTIAAAAEALGFPSGSDVTNVVERQYQRRGDNSATWRDFFGARNLATINAICEVGAAELGYLAKRSQPPQRCNITSSPLDERMP